MNSHLLLFKQVPVGALFFRDPFNERENPSIKEDDNHARKPNGDVVEVNGGVLVFTLKPAPIPVVIPVAIVHDDLIVEIK